MKMSTHHSQYLTLSPKPNICLSLMFEQIFTQVMEIISYNQDVCLCWSREEFSQADVPTNRVLIRRGLLLRDQKCQDGIDYTVNEIARDLPQILETQWQKANAKCHVKAAQHKAALALFGGKERQKTGR